MLRVLSVVLAAIVALGGLAVSADEVVYINSAEQLCALSLRVAEGDSLEGVQVYLTCDLSLSGPFTPIGGDPSHPFSGDFDGGDHVVSGLAVQGEGYLGLFGCVTDGSVKNLVIENATVNGGDYCGILVGRLYSFGSGARVENCKVSGSVNGNCYAGGLVGMACGASYGRGGAALVSECDASVDVLGDMYVGGIVGKAEARGQGGAASVTLRNCQSRGSLSVKGKYGTMGGGLCGALSSLVDTGSASALITDSVSFAHVSVEKAAAGGLCGAIGAVGDTAAVSVENSVAFGNIEGGALSGGLCGKCESDGGRAVLSGCVAAGNVFGGSVCSLSLGEGVENCVRALRGDVPLGFAPVEYASLDANGDGAADSADASLILRYDLGLGYLGISALNSCDADGDGTVDSTDAAAALRLDLGL